MAAPLTLDTIDIIGPDTYQSDGYPHEAWKLLRREAPVFWWDRGVQNPFWALTKYEDIVHVSKQPKIFQNGPRMAVLIDGNAADPENPGEGAVDEDEDRLVRQLLNMDPPEHGQYRKVSSSWFTPRTIQRLAPGVEKITSAALDDLASRGSEADFVEVVTAPLTLSVLADMLGAPANDWPLLFEWTNQIAGSADPEYRVEGATQFETVKTARESLFKYFAELGQKRLAEPKNDIVSVIMHGKVKGKSLPPLELLSYFLVLVVAGNETTRNAASGGLLALMENPAELEKLKRDPGLIDSAVEEIVRWTNPVIQFCRTPNQDVEVRGQKIRAGENMCLFYPSANRDEDIFEDPYAFRVDRDPNPHLGFGIGEHFCLGANLARLELSALFRQLIERVDEIELAGKVDRVRSSFLGGIKRMPIRYTMR